MLLLLYCKWVLTVKIAGVAFLRAAAAEYVHWVTVGGNTSARTYSLVWTPSSGDLAVGSVQSCAVLRGSAADAAAAKVGVVLRGSQKGLIVEPVCGDLCVSAAQEPPPCTRPPARSPA